MSEVGKGRLTATAGLYGIPYKKSNSMQHFDHVGEMLKGMLHQWNQLTKHLPKRTTRYMGEMRGESDYGV